MRATLVLIILAVSPSTQAQDPAVQEAAAIEWVPLPGGTFLMGSSSGADNEKPSHRVTVRPFQIAKTEVTRKQYKACVDAGFCQVPNCLWPPPTYPESEPVVCVDWKRVSQFLQWMGARLPTEAEWEYAARSGGKDQTYPWGDQPATCQRAVISSCEKRGPRPVCSKPQGHTEQGLCDMAGNAEEWVQDWYHPSYEGAPDDGSAWESPATPERVGRGGSWRFGASEARASARDNMEPDYWLAYLGFRPVRKEEAVPPKN